MVDLGRRRLSVQFAVAACAMRFVLVWLLTLGWTGTAAAQSRDAGARMERLADGVYVILHDDATEEWPHSNTGVIVGDDGVLVVDATYLPSRAKADIALIRSVTKQPVRYLAYTHWHFDHTNGAVAYREAFPGLTVVGERESRHFIDLNSTYWARMSTAPTSARRAALERLQAQLASGKHSAGKALPPEVQSALAVSVRQREGELQELASLKVIVPDLVFDQELSLTLGRRRIELHNWDRANSPKDVTIYLPDERVLFTGDILVRTPYPYFFSSWPVPWIDVLRQLEAIPVASLVPGHGEVMRNHAYTRLVRELMEAVTSKVDSMARQGMTLDQIQSALSAEEFRLRFTVDNPEFHRDHWKSTINTLVERAWRGVRGNG